MRNCTRRAKNCRASALHPEPMPKPRQTGSMSLDKLSIPRKWPRSWESAPVRFIVGFRVACLSRALRSAVLSVFGKKR